MICKASKLLCTLAIATAAVSLAVSSAHAGHVYAGIIDTNGSGTLNAGDALQFVSNTTGAVVTGSSLGVQSMTPVTVGAQAGLYANGNISFTALAGTALEWTGTGADATGAYRAKSAFSAAAGSFIEMQISSVTSLNTGAKFSFWDEGSGTPTFTFTIGTGLTLGTGKMELTDRQSIVGNGISSLAANPNAGVAYSYANYAPVTDGLPGGFTWNDADGTGPSNAVTDPYGHIHGRNYTADTAGDYTVSFILHDATGQQADSAPFVVTYSAVPEPASVTLIGCSVAMLAFMRRRKNA